MATCVAELCHSQGPQATKNSRKLGGTKAYSHRDCPLLRKTQGARLKQLAMGDIVWEKNPIGKGYVPFYGHGHSSRGCVDGQSLASVWSILSLTGYNPESYSNLLQ